MNFNKQSLEKFVHPETGESFVLHIDSMTGDTIDSGRLETPSGEYYHVVNNIPRFVDKSNYTSNFGFQWNKYSKTQLDSFSKIPISENRIKEVLPIPITSLKNKLVLESGSGAGRFTEILIKYGCDLFTFDFSSAVDANFINNKEKGHFQLFQGNIYKIPIKKEQFDFVFCLGVLQHTPDPALSFDCLADQVKPGGMLIVDAYERNKYSKFQWKYILRPLTKNMKQQRLYSLVKIMVTVFLPFSILLSKVLGRLGTKFFPVADFYDIKFESYKVRKQWSILDTFDWYSPTYDIPQSSDDLRAYFSKYDFENVEIFHGSNGVIGRGTKPNNL